MESFSVIEEAPIQGSEALLQAYKDMVYRLALVRTKSPTDAEDITMEVFVRALRRRPEWKSREHQKAWFITTAVNCSKSFLTSAFRRHTVPEKEDIPIHMPEHSEVYDAVLALPENYRTAVHLHYFEGYGVREIAQMMHSGESTVKSWLFRARDLLRKQLKGAYFDV